MAMLHLRCEDVSTWSDNTIKHDVGRIEFMMLLQQPIQRKLSALLGAEVTFDKLNFSLLGGSIEAVGVKVGDLLTVDRVVAKVAVARAIKGEIVVTSLTIEKPVVTLIRSADGSFNLPKSKKSEPPKSVSDKTIPSDDNEESRWSFDAEKVLVVDGQIQLSAGGGYRASIEKLLVELKRKDTGYAVTLLADSVGRRDIPIDLGQLRGTATITNAPDLTALPPRAAAEANLELGDKIKLKLRTPEIRRRVVDVAFDGTVDFALLKSLLP